MPPKRNAANTDGLGETSVAAQLASLCSKFDNLVAEVQELKKIIEVKDEKISSLNCEVTSLKEEVNKLKNMIDDEDAYVRRESIILSGTAVPEVVIGEICVNIARDLIKSNLKIDIKPHDVSVAHRLGPKTNAQGADKRPIIVKFSRRDLKRQVLFAKKDNSNAASSLWTNESLTPKRRTIMFVLRKLKKNRPEIVTGCNTLEGRCFAYTKTPRSQPRTRNHDMKHVVNTLEALKSFCTEFIKKPLDEFLQQWDH